jgi:hypothetical protein
MNKPILTVYCVHEDLAKNVECTPIEEDDQMSGFWYECPICKKEFGVMLEVKQH